ncbi:MAG: phosphate ABC transporter substrate-binding protein PstS family protein, partial [Anaerolineaceae bacterium]|nr:phosphate ABC transporter substrate-binding protein PstS family protein [Anaerolineaceae bacterium]
MRSKSVLFVISVLLIAAFALSACAAPTAAPTTAPVAEATEAPVATAEVATEVAVEPGMLPEVDPSTVTGDIISAGSSTVYPLSEAVQALFEQEGYTGQHTLSSIGSGGGFERFCKTGETDISNASRGIKDSEVESCGALSPARTPVEFRVGTDAIAIVVSKENTFLTNVTLEELGLIFTTATKWSDVNPEWPAEDILRFTPGTDSGTFDFFTEEVIQGPQDIDELDDAKALVLAASNLQTSEDDNTLVQGVLGSPYAIGYFGYAYFNDQSDNLTAVSIDGVTPSVVTAEDGSYALARPLFIYSDAGVIAAKPQIGAFINFYLTRVNEVIFEVGYFPASETALNDAKMKLAEILK